ncbi:MAG: hypothetical protein H6745_03525 [Deltaproteobacteria bacterium]|nr:hypothetical protein [Deltaproteobacteria bacterium]
MTTSRPLFSARLAALAATTLLATACASAPPTNAGPGSDRGGPFEAPLFGHAEPDSAYVFASDGVTREELSRNAGRYVPALREIAAALHELLALWDGAQDPRGALAEAAMYEDFIAVLADFMDPATLADLGVRFPLRMALYADGLFPVMRVALADPARTKNAVARALANVDFVHPSGPGEWRGAISGIGLVLTITEDELVATASLEADAAAAAARATAPPRKANAAPALAALAKAERTRSVGWLGLGDLSRELVELIGALGPGWVDACDDEMRRFFAGFPRLLFGSESGARGGRAVVRVALDDPEIAQILASMAQRSRTLAAPPPRPGFSFSLALDVDGVLGIGRLLRDRARAARYTCPDVVEIVDDLDLLVKQLTIAKLQMHGIRGLVARGVDVPDLSDVVSTFMELDVLVGLVFSSSEDVVSMLGDKAFEVPDSGEPVPLDQGGRPMAFARRGDLLGYAIGEHATRELAAVMQAGTVASAALAQYEKHGADDGAAVGSVANTAVTDLLATLPALPPAMVVADPAIVVDGERVPVGYIYDEIARGGVADAEVRARVLLHTAVTFAAVKHWLHAQGEPDSDDPPFERLARWVAKRRAAEQQQQQQRKKKPAARKQGQTGDAAGDLDALLDAAAGEGWDDDGSVDSQAALLAYAIANRAVVDTTPAEPMFTAIAAFDARIDALRERIVTAARRLGGLTTDESMALTVDGSDLVIRSESIYGD